MKNITFILLILFSGIIHAQKNPCKKWKNGNFIVYTDEGKKISITRKGSKQVEVNSATGVKEELKITWINNCTYQITRKEKDAVSKKLHPELTVVVKIVDSYDDHCLIFVYSNMAGDVGYLDCMYLLQKNEQEKISP